MATIDSAFGGFKQISSLLAVDRAGKTMFSTTVTETV